MKKIFFNDQSHLRNGWWILIFIGFIALTRPIYKPIKEALAELGLTAPLLEPLPSILILLATWACLLIRRQRFSDVGLKLNLVWVKEFVTGTAVGVLMILATVVIIWSIGGVKFALDPERSIKLLSYGFYLFLFGSIMEELLHRGFIFQRLIDGIGIWGAQLIIAAIFAFGHAGNPGMEGTTEIIATLDLVMGSLIFGLAYIKTKSLALPIGLHLGWNWSQGSIFGFGVTGFEQPGFFQPQFTGMEQWLTGGEFGPEASIFSIIVGAITFVLLYRWKNNKEISEPLLAENKQVSV